MQFVEYFMPKEMRYLPAFEGKLYLLQTNRHNLNNLNDSNVSKIISKNLGSISKN